MKKLSYADLVLNRPLPFSVYDSKGWLMVNQGTVLSNIDQVTRLIRRGVFRGEQTATTPAERPAAAPSPLTRPVAAPAAESQTPVFERVTSAIIKLKHILTTALKQPDQINLVERIRALAMDIQNLCQEDTDATLAAPYLDHQNPDIIVHQVMGAVAMELVAKRQGFDPEARLPYLCAALTRDIGQLGFQSELEKCLGPLTDSLKSQVWGHTLQSMALLAKFGVTDSSWMESIQLHHERLDGSGYPHQLQDEAISWGGRALAVVDVYSAMARPRLHRGNKSHAPMIALRNLFAGKEAAIDNQILQMLIKETGLAPPGSLVRLANGEIAVVKHRTSNLNDTQVFSVYNPRGLPLTTPLPRSTSNPEYAMSSTVAFEECRSATLTIKRVWTK
jgi:HD-GYP domain-containing protein (c-di-GMP phosphodiesterase class II)